MRLFEKVDRNFRWKYVLGVGAAVLLAGVSVASYSRPGVVSQKNVVKSSFDQSAKQTTQAKVNQSTAKLPLSFEPNQGQTDPRVKYIARANGYTVFLTPDEAVLRMKGTKEDGVLQMKLRNANPASRIEALDQQTAKSNYFIGNDRSKWITGVANYGKVNYHNVYPGVDVNYSGNQRNLEYDFVVKPGADPKQIRVAYEGSSRFVLNHQGDLELQTAAGATVARKPVVYQTIHGQRKPVEASYVLTASNEVGFQVGAYDKRETLVIDPIVNVLSFLGGTGQDQGNAIAVNKIGAVTGVYLTGQTTSVNTFPLTPNPCAAGVPSPCSVTPTTNIVATTTPAYQSLNHGQNDVFVTKLDPTGMIIQYSTYIGGSQDDVALGIAVDASGDAYITGRTLSVSPSTGYPISIGAFPAGAAQVAFVTELNPTGNGLIYSEALGAAGATQGNAITLDASNNAYVGGYTSGGLSSIATGIQSGAFGGGSSDGFVAQVAPGGGVTFMAYLGGSGPDSVNALALDGSGNIYVAGTTSSFASFPSAGSAVASSAVTNGNAANPNSIGFATEIKVGFTGLSYSATFGGGGNGNALTPANGNFGETAVGIALDASNNAYIVGSTTSNSWLGSAIGGSTPPVSGVINGAAPVSGNLAEGYLLTLSSNGKTEYYVDYGPASSNLATGTSSAYTGVVVDEQANAYVTGTTTTTAAGANAYLARYLYTVALNTAGTPVNVPGPVAATALNTISIAGPAAGNDTLNAVALTSTHQAFVLGTSNSVSLAAVATAPGVGLAAVNGLSDQGGSNVGGTVANIGLFNESLGTVPAPPAAGSVPPYVITASATPGKNAIYANIQFSDIQLSASSLTLTATLNQSLATVPVAYISASTLGACTTLTVTPGGTTPGSFAITPLTVTATGNLYQVSATTDAVIGPTTATFTFGGTNCDNVGSQSLVVPITLNVGTPLAAVPQTALTGLTEGYNTGIIVPLTNTANALGIVPVSVSTAAGSFAYNVAIAGNSTKAVSSGPSGINYPGGLVSFTTNPNGSGTVASLTPGTNASPVASLFYVVVNPTIGAPLQPGTYTATIAVSAPGVTTVNILFSLVVTSGVTAGPSFFSFPFLNNTSPAQQQASLISVANQAGGPFSYTTSYAPTPCVTGSCPVAGGSAGLPFANVSILAGATGSVTANSSVSLVMQVMPTGLAPGSYAGQITITPTNASAPTSIISVLATVGGGLVVAAPSGGTLNVTLPVGYQTLAVPSNVLPFSQIYIADAQVSGSPQITINSPANASPGVVVSGLPAGVLTFTSGFDCDANNCTYNPGNSGGSSGGYTITFNTIGLTVGTVYSGTVTFTGKAGNSSFTATVPVNLTVSATPAVIAQSNPVSGPPVPLTSVTISAVVGQTTVCTGTLGQSVFNPSFYTNGGALGTATFAPSANFITSPTALNGTFQFTAAGTGVAFCVNPQLLGNAPGRYTGNVILTVPGAANSPLTIPVVLLLGNTPGHIELSNAGVYRAVGGLGAFALNLDQVTYNYAAGNTLTRFFGLPGDQPVAGDWLGTGTVTLGVFRAAAGAWYFDLNNDGAFEANEGPFFFGLPGDKAIVGDWTGSGSTKVGVFRCPASGVCTWYLSTAVQTAATLVPNANLYSPATTLTYNYGLPGDLPVASSWTQTGVVDQIGVFRCPAVGVCSWIVDSAGTGASFTTYSFGLPGDIPVVGDWGDLAQPKRIGVFRGGTWILDVNGSNTYAPNDIMGAFGLPGDIPVVGKWTML